MPITMLFDKIMKPIKASNLGFSNSSFVMFRHFWPFSVPTASASSAPFESPAFAGSCCGTIKGDGVCSNCCCGSCCGFCGCCCCNLCCGEPLGELSGDRHGIRILPLSTSTFKELRQ